MKPSIPWSFALALAGLAASDAQALGRLADVAIVDRESGNVLPVHAWHGEYWVEGRPGARYSIRIRNTEGGRILAVTSVDGINVVSGERAGLDQRGYVYDAWGSYDINGWRKSTGEVAAFEFTSVPRSYAVRTGRPDDVGVIGVAVFRERAPVVKVSPSLSDGALASDESAARERAAEPSTALAAPAQALGTGHGRREDSWVTQVPFERARHQPDEIVRVRYDSRANLVALGVIPRPTPSPHRPDPFPAGPQLGYVPDP